MKLQNTITKILIIASALILTACGGDPKGSVKNGVLELDTSVDDPRGLVKNGVLQFDTSVTVGNVLDGYGYFKSTSWETFETSQGRTVVEFNGVMDLDAYAGSRLEGILLTADKIDQLKRSMKELMITYRTQFSVSKIDNSFQVQYSGIRITGFENGEDTSSDVTDDDLSGLARIYKNQPEQMTWRLLFLL